jgi:hypothetical protein
MSEDLSLSLFLLGIVVVVGWFAWNLIRSYVVRLSPLPGVIFNFLIDLYRPGESQENFQNRIKDMEGRLIDISSDVSGYIRKRYRRKVTYSQDVTRTVANCSICLRSFIRQVAREPETLRMDYDQYRRGATKLVNLFNKFPRRIWNTRQFMEELVACKKDIYFSLLGQTRHDEAVTTAFLQDFRDKALKIDPNRPESIEAYLSELTTKWINNNQKLRQIEREYILPLFTVRNLLHFCAEEHNAIAKETVDRITKKLTDYDFTEVVYFGLTFDRDYVVERIYEQAASKCADLRLVPIPGLAPAT